MRRVDRFIEGDVAAGAEVPADTRVLAEGAIQ
jgi:hypothetical protein